MRKITEVQFVHQRNNNPIVIVITTFDDLLEKEIFQYNSNQMSLNTKDIIGFTEDQAHSLMKKKYSHYTNNKKILKTL